MSFSPDSLRNKLASLDETQDSIVSTSQWVLFYYRNAPVIVGIWDEYLKKVPPKKKLSLIYLANDVVQQARAKKRTEFIDAFGKTLPIALTNAYSSVPEPIKLKIVKIVNIWKERRIFPVPVEVDGISSSSGSTSKVGSSSPQESFEALSNEEKLKILNSSSQKFGTFYHQLLLSSRGPNATGEDSKYLEKLVDTIDETVAQLTDLKESITRESKTLKERSEAIKQKKIELEQKQKEIEIQKKAQEEKILGAIRQQKEEQRLKEQKILEELQRQKEEDALLPTYENDSDESEDSDNEKEDKEESRAPTPEDLNDDEADRPAKKLRFAD